MSSGGLELKLIQIDPEQIDDEKLLPAAEALRRGQLVAFPTETVYGLGADANDPAAVARIFAAKGRPPDNPLIVHLADPDQLGSVARQIPPLALRLLEAFAPGPLTLVLPRSSHVPDIVTAGLDTVAVRFPAHPVARRLLQLARVPVAAPSANRSGRPSPTRAWHVLEDLGDRIPFLIDGGPCEYGLESTVLDLSTGKPVILRPGSITAEDIASVAGLPVSAVLPDRSDGSAAPRAPGMKYRHYAPRARVQIFQPPQTDREREDLDNQIRALTGEGNRAGLFASRATLDGLKSACRLLDSGEKDLAALPPGSCAGFTYGLYPDPVAASRHLFDGCDLLDRLAWMSSCRRMPRRLRNGLHDRLAKAAGQAVRSFCLHREHVPQPDGRCTLQPAAQTVGCPRAVGRNLGHAGGLGLTRRTGRNEPGLPDQPCGTPCSPADRWPDGRSRAHPDHDGRAEKGLVGHPAGSCLAHPDAG